ncbi:RNase P/MRP, p29 subunit [Myriangium duriaei CBS 260.36]|uniref:Ribonuclease P protein subunit n=1 Tax=Myriangium duriaei CBS 260.36 TaxID=1168546 RepID=A0A9P4IWC3_9PEZI|nr:RNase P/MRP, p29 subunit [Myriangium duriaei CBS 260.36]
MPTPDPSAHPAHALLSRAHSPPTATTLYTDSIKHRPLLLRPSSPPPPPSSRSSRRLTRQSAATVARRTAKLATNSGRASLAARPKPLSAKQKRKLGVYEVGKEQRKWGLYIGLHSLWCDYMREVLGVTPSSVSAVLTADGAGPLLASADMHGAVVTVVRSGCVSRVGLEGIVVRDTKFTFEIVTRRDRLVVVPKEGTVFRIEVPREGTAVEELGQGEGEGGKKKRLVFEVYGDQFMTAAPDRANRKFKIHIDPGL